MGGIFGWTDVRMGGMDGWEGFSDFRMGGRKSKQEPEGVPVWVYKGEGERGRVGLSVREGEWG